MSTYKLPDLSYDYGALEPHISGEIMELHHSKHHSTYVTGANTALEQLEEARASEDFGTLAALERALAFNVSGHVLHSLFWQNLAPDGESRPDGALASAIDRDFGSFDALRAQLTHGASTVMGSGWAALTWEPVARRLLTAQIYDHQSNMTQAGIPLLVLDAWEHAYYLQYQSRKADFFEAVWNCWNWEDVARRFAAAQRLDIGVADAVGAPAGATAGKAGGSGRRATRSR